jgi:hypothetical protein
MDGTDDVFDGHELLARLPDVDFRPRPSQRSARKAWSKTVPGFRSSASKTRLDIACSNAVSPPMRICRNWSAPSATPESRKESEEQAEPVQCQPANARGLRP